MVYAFTWYQVSLIAVKGEYLTFMHVYKPIGSWITQDARQNIVDALWTLIFRMGLWLCHSMFCQGRVPVGWLMIAATRSLFDYCTSMSKNPWWFVDAHLQDGAGSMMLIFLTWKAANTSFGNGCNPLRLRLPNMQSQKSLTLRWRSFSQWGSDHVGYYFAKKEC